ncbi:MAG: pyridoxal-phosphate dependent enzyme [Firmicutes bacterium]|nr:pyridoxal-phosphate dependent enzyme [Bacillota bacterium]
MQFYQFDKVKLFEKPTPLQKLENFGRHHGFDNLYMKRDDSMLLGLGGNKLRNLEYWLAQAKKEGADLIIAAGGLQSNQCRLTAAACAKLNLNCRIYHNDQKPEKLEGNLLLNDLLGAQAVFLGAISEEERNIQVAQEVNRLREQGFRPYLIGDPALGALGYADSAFELVEQAQSLGLKFDHVFIVGAMNITATGFLYGTALLDAPFKVHVISVEYPLKIMEKKIEEIWLQLIELTGIEPQKHYSRFALLSDDTLGSGYAEPTAQSRAAIRSLAAREGIFLEQVYGGKTLAGLLEKAKLGEISGDQKICIFHTGGYGALFTQAEILQ